jgi:phage FluMu protein Com
MPYWVLKCPECKIHFTHSEVHVGREHYGLWMLPPKPEFPEGGSWIECPNCKKISLFQRFQLTYAATA